MSSTCIPPKQLQQIHINPNSQLRDCYGAAIRRHEMKRHSKAGIERTNVNPDATPSLHPDNSHKISGSSAQHLLVVNKKGGGKRSTTNRAPVILNNNDNVIENETLLNDVRNEKNVMDNVSMCELDKPMIFANGTVTRL
jgi:hypothetical protein